MSNKTKQVPKQEEILIVEDSPTQAEQLRYLLDQCGYKVTVAKDGKEALTLLDGYKPALVISDISMPEMNGYALCKQLKEAENTRDIPVILLTSLTNPEDVLEGLACGADSFITKPYSTDYLLAHIQQMITNWKLHIHINEPVRVGVEVLFAGKRRFISADQQQMLGLLLSTYEAAVQRNTELVHTQEELHSLNEHLEELVEERTRALSLEIADHKHAEQALRESNAFNTMLLKTIPLGMDIVNETGQLLFIDPALEKMLGKDIIGKRCWDLYKDDKKQCKNCPLKVKIKTGETAVIETSGVMGGRVFEISHTGITYQGEKAILEVFHDVTERKQAEEQLNEYSEHLEEMVEDRTRELREAQEELVRKEKLAVLGTLAGGVGHELRNPLGVISNAVYYLNMVQPEASEKIKNYHALIEMETHNATKIVGDLLDYARVISTDPKPGSVRELVEHTLSRFPVPVGVQISLRIPDSLPQGYADPLHVEQVLGNLITNACQAMSKFSLDTKAGSVILSDGGKLTITARILVPVSVTYPESSKGRYRQKQMLAIAVKDTGTGISTENMQKLFEPLFSTKVTGIGLGLAVSKKLAEANGGHIEVESEVGKGSTFTLYLPIVSAELGS